MSGRQIEITNSCPPIIDPKTGNPLDFFSTKGQDCFRGYLKHYLREFLEETKDDWNYILPKQLKEMRGQDYFLLDVRKPEDYKKKHIKGSVNIFWLDLLQEENLKTLPKDKKIIIICYLGHTASQILVMLKLLGYDAIVLKFGMGISPLKDVPIAGWDTLGYPTTAD